MLSNYQHVLWDWNGTLLDDRELALSVVNHMLERRGQGPISQDTYLSLFDHPVMDFYQAIGLRPEVMPIAEVAHEFQSGYAAGSCTCQLQPGATPALHRPWPPARGDAEGHQPVNCWGLGRHAVLDGTTDEGVIEESSPRVTKFSRRHPGPGVAASVGSPFQDRLLTFAEIGNGWLEDHLHLGACEEGIPVSLG